MDSTPLLEGARSPLDRFRDFESQLPTHELSPQIQHRRTQAHAIAVCKQRTTILLGEVARLLLIVVLWSIGWWGLSIGTLAKRWQKQDTNEWSGLLVPALWCALVPVFWAVWSASAAIPQPAAHRNDGGRVYIWCANRAQTMAAMTCAFLGAGCAVLADWAPLQTYEEDATDVQSFLFSLGGLCLTVFVSYYGFRLKGCVLALAVIYLNVWQTVASLALRDSPRGDQEWISHHPKLYMALAFGQLGLLCLEVATEALLVCINCQTQIVQLAFATADAIWIFVRVVLLFWQGDHFLELWTMPVMAAISLFFLVGDLFLRVNCIQNASQRPSDGQNHKYVRLAEQDQASIFSRYTFWWVLPTLRSANRFGRLDIADLPQLPQQDMPMYLFRRFGEEWQGEPLNGWKLLVKICYSVQRTVFFSSMLHGWAYQLLMLLDPIILNKLLKNSDKSNSTNDSDLSNSFILVGLLSVSMFIRVTFMEVCFFASTRVNNNARTVLVTSVFRKVLRGEESPDYDSGSLTNLMATDADKIGKTSWMLFFFAQWSWAILSLPVVIYFVYQVVGSAIWMGVATMLLGGVVTRKMSNFVRPAVLASQEKRDIRSQLIKEILSSITAIKLQAGEEEWIERVKLARAEEMKEIFKIRVLSAVNSAIGTVVFVAVPVSIFAWYVAVEGRELDSTTAFTTLAWIAQMRWSINVLPDIYNMYASLAPSCDRLAKFFNDETLGSVQSWLSLDDTESEENFNSSVTSLPPDTAVAIQGVLGYRQAGGKEVTTVLKDINLSVPRGKFMIIVGAVGSGKSTLLAAMSKGLPMLKGSCQTRGSRAYVSQIPFLLNDSVENNIIFGKPLDELRFQQCVHDAALEQDLESFQKGRYTVIGDKGVQLSGGQKARLALARALYMDRDIYFLDDVLSAVDATTGQFLWKNTLINGLVRRGKTVVLVTHQLQYLSRSEIDLVAAVADGNIIVGTWEEVKSQVNEDISSFVETRERTSSTPSSPSSSGSVSSRSASDDEDSQGQATGTGGSASLSANDKTKSKKNKKDTKPSRKPKEEPNYVTLEECETRIQMLLDEQRDRVLDDRVVEEIMAALRGDNSQSEKKNVGVIAWRDFKVYLQAFGTRLTLILLGIILIATAVSNVVMNVWLSVWGDTPHASINYLYVYVALGFAAAFLAGLEVITLALCAFSASQVIHEYMIHVLIGASMGYFNRTPSGHLQNRFLQDLSNIDIGVPDCIVDQLKKTLSMVTQIGLVLLFAPWVIATLPLIMIPYMLVFGTVRCAARDSRRLEAMAHTPVYNQFSDVLRGKLSIRAYAVEPLFESWNFDLVRDMSQGRYSNEAVGKWAQTLTTQNGCLLYLVCGFMCVVLVSRGDMTLGQLGLVLLYSAQLQRASMDYMMGLTTVETNFVSVERIADFLRTPDEFEQDNKRIEKLKLARRSWSMDSLHEPEVITPEWPERGAIEVKDVHMRYDLHRHRVLNGLSFSVGAGEKVALSGRTGCGKSSTFGILCRLYPMSSGEVKIDGIDISEVPLKRLRSAIRVITQDSVLVAGTLRSNLMSGGPGASESDLWDALAKVNLKTMVENQPGGLDCVVEDGGRNFSVGQRQLLCTARALLPRYGCAPRVLLCDEPTANIDLNSDRKIHDVILSLDATVIMICHRLQHVPRFDKVVVLAPGGRLLEQGAPRDLLADPTSAMSDLFVRAGLRAE